MKIGTQIRLIREEKAIDKVRLSKGLCSSQALDNLEENLAVADKLLTDILLQRLGKSPDKLEVILPFEEYQRERMRDMIEELIGKGKKKQAEYLLKQYPKRFAKPSPVQTMYVYRCKAMIAYRLEHDTAKAKEWLEKALDITLPGWKVRSFFRYLISTIEMENLLAYGLMLLKEAEQEKGIGEAFFEVRDFLEACCRYIKRHFTDEEEYAKIFSKCAWLLGRVYLRSGEDSRAFAICDEAFQKLSENAIYYFMPPLLKLAGTCQVLEEQEERKAKLKNYQAVLVRIKELYGEQCYCEDCLFHNCYQKAYYLDYEFIKGERLARGFTQETLIEGIYESPETLSRVENGKLSPNLRTFTKLMDRLSTEKERYNSLVITDSFQILELHREINRLLSQRNYGEAGQKITELKTSLDLEIEENARTVQYLENIMAYRLKEAPYEVLLESAMKRLKSTYLFSGKTMYRAPTKNETELLVQVAILLRYLGRKEEAERLCQMAWQAMRRDKVDIKYRHRAYSVLSSSLAIARCSVALAEDNIRETFRCGKLGGFGINLMTIACAQINDESNREHCKELLRLAYCLSELMQNETDKEKTRLYYRQKFGEELT